MNKSKTGKKHDKLTIDQFIEDGIKTGAFPGHLVNELKEWLQQHPEEKKDWETMFKSHLYPNKAITWFKWGLCNYEEWNPNELAIMLRIARLQTESGYVALTNKEIQIMTGMSKNTIIKSMKSLIEKEALRSVGSIEGRTVYQLNPNVTQRGKDRTDNNNWPTYTTNETWERGIRTGTLDIVAEGQDASIRAGVFTYKV